MMRRAKPLILLLIALMLPLSAAENDTELLVRGNQEVLASLVAETASRQSELSAEPVPEESEEEEASLRAEALSDKSDSPFKDGLVLDGLLSLTLVRGDELMPGFTLKAGYRWGGTEVSAYGRLDYPLKPLGVSTGAFVIRELKLEAGADFAFTVHQQKRRESRLFIDVGYYMQFLEYARHPGNVYLVNNGLILRPGFSTMIDLGLVRLEVGIYFQQALYPRYEGYDGTGIYLKLF